MITSLEIPKIRARRQERILEVYRLYAEHGYRNKSRIPSIILNNYIFRNLHTLGSEEASKDGKGIPGLKISGGREKSLSSLSKHKVFL